MDFVNGAPTDGFAVDKDTFNLCSECCEQLKANEDGYSTEHGTCDRCIWDDEE